MRGFFFSGTLYSVAMAPIIWAAINTYMDGAVLPECLDSLKSCLPPGSSIIAVDGVYRAFAEESKILAAVAQSEGRTAIVDELLKYTKPISDDGTLELLHKAGAITIINPKPWENEQTKRSQYLKFPSDGDWIFVIDSDERLMGRLPTVQELEALGGTDFNVSLQRDDAIGPYDIMRVHKKQGFMEYRGAHHALWRGDRLIRKDDLIEQGKCLNGFHLYHFWMGRAERTPLRQQAKGAYYHRLMEEEKMFRAEHKV